MQFDPSRAFPYPVLRPGVDDYVDGDIQATVAFEYSENEAELDASIDFAVSVPEIRAEIEKGRAVFTCVFACRDTYFRKSIASKESKYGAKFPAGSLRGEVIISPYVVAVQDIVDYRAKWINKEFGTGPFSFKVGSPLAIERPQAVFIDRDSFKPISSCFVLIKKDGIPDNEWRVEASQDKIHIAVSASMKAKLDLARNSKRSQALLLNSLYFSAVMQCVSHLKNGEDYSDYRWANVFRQRMSESKVDVKTHDESWIAQTLMKHPFSLLNTYMFQETVE